MMNRRTIKIAFLALTAFAGLSLVASILLPWINLNRRNRDGETAIRNMSQIGLGVLLYTMDYHGQYPDSLATLVLREKLSPRCLVNPMSDQTPATGSTPAEIDTKIRRGGHQTVIYLGASLTDKTATTQTVVAYDPAFDGTNVLCGDGSTIYLDAQKTKAMIASISTTRPTTLPMGIWP